MSAFWLDCMVFLNNTDTGIMVGIATAMNWGSTYAFTQAFPSILASFQTFGTLYMLCFIDLCAALFSLFLLPETKVL